MKKLAIFTSIALLGATCAVGFVPKPVEVKAEGEETSQTAEPTPEAPAEEAPAEEVPTEENKTDWSDVVIDGKPVGQWIAEIKNAETRRSAIIALAISSLGAVLLILKWLTERGLLNKTSLLTKLNGEQIDKMKEQYEASKAQFKEQFEATKAQFKEQYDSMKLQFDEQKLAYENKIAEMQGNFQARLEQAQQVATEQAEQFKREMEHQELAFSERISKASEILEKDTEERQNIREALLTMSQDNADYVAAGTFKKVRAIFGESNDGKE